MCSGQNNQLKNDQSGIAHLKIKKSDLQYSTAISDKEQVNWNDWSQLFLSVKDNANIYEQTLKGLIKTNVLVDGPLFEAQNYLLM